MVNNIEEIRVLEQRIKALESRVIYLKSKETADLKAHIERLKLRKSQLEINY